MPPPSRAQAAAPPSHPPHPRPPAPGGQASQLLTLGVAWFVYDSPAALALNVLAAFAVAQPASAAVWRQPAHYQRPRGEMVLFVAAIAACYWAPMCVQAAYDLAAHAAHAAAPHWAPAAALAAAAGPPPPLAAAACAAGTAGALAAGALVFATGFPERAWPGVFDIVGFSHQLMHVAAGAAHVAQYAFILEMAARRRAAAAGAPPLTM